MVLTLLQTLPIVPGVHSARHVPSVDDPADPRGRGRTLPELDMKKKLPELEGLVRALTSKGVV